ncbi:helix-turn-helix domain-containing protein [Flavobacterium sp. RHBU_24]|uniref:helix-turn-helix domain-containing protein n=1 Tax=Flavobacterium sp. RHBU_24 TaxID=3391185 RepID=UPI0039852ADE
MEEEVIEIIILELDYYLIERVRELRIRHTPYLSQLKLAQELEFPESYVSKVENMKIRYKYNVRALNKIANFFNLKSYAELFPRRIVPNDLVKMKLKKLPIKNGKLKVNDDGTIDKAYAILSLVPLTEKELSLWYADQLPYLTIIE